LKEKNIKRKNYNCILNECKQQDTSRKRHHLIREIFSFLGRFGCPRGGGVILSRLSYFLMVFVSQLKKIDGKENSKLVIKIVENSRNWPKLSKIHVADQSYPDREPNASLKVHELILDWSMICRSVPDLIWNLSNPQYTIKLNFLLPFPTMIQFSIQS